MSFKKVFTPLLLIVFFITFAIAQNDSGAIPNPAPATQVTTETPEQAPVTALSKSDKLRLFAPAQFDSVLGLLPGGDSIRSTLNIVAIGLDSVTGDLVIIYFDPDGNPVKTVFPATVINRGHEKQTIPAPAVIPPRTKLDQSGRTWFILETTAKSGFIYSMGYDNLLNGKIKEQAIGGLSLLTIGGALYGSYAFTRNMELGYGRVGMMNFGATVFGTYYPLFLKSFLRNATSIDEKYYGVESFYIVGGNPGMTDPDSSYIGITTTDKIHAWTSMIGLPLGIYFSSRLDLAGHDEYGKVALMEYFSQSFIGLAFALPVFYFDFATRKDSQNYFATSNALAMVLVPAGVYTGYKLSAGKDISAGRGALPWVTGIGGALTGLGLSSLPDDYDGISSMRWMLASSIAGYLGGTYMGFSYHPSIDYTFWQTVFIGASTACGAGIADAFPLIAAAHSRQPFIIASIIGGWAGFYFGERLSLNLFEKSSRDRHASPVKFELPGLAALPVMMAIDKNHSSKLSTAGRLPAVPLANFEWRF